MSRLSIMLLAAFGAACGGSGGGPDGGAADAIGGGGDGPCGAACDQDGDGVLDEDDLCPNTSAIGIVNDEGCNDQQVDPMLQETFPPYGLTWTPEGDAGRAGGLTWTYTGIQRGDLFHIYWMVCDDPALPCGLSFNGAIDDPAEDWVASEADSDLAAGKLVLINTTQLELFDATIVPLNGRITVTVVNASDTALPFETAAAIGATTRTATHGAEVIGVGFKVTLLAEVDDGGSGWTPYLDYFDGAHKPDTYEPVTISFDGIFYDE